MKFKGSTWSGPFLLNIVVCAIINLAFLCYIFGQFESNLKHDISATPETRTIPTYLALFIFAQVSQKRGKKSGRNKLEIEPRCGD